MSDEIQIAPDWRWGTPEGSRELDRIIDRSLPFGEKLRWLEEAEELSLRLREGRENQEEESSSPH